HTGADHRGCQKNINGSQPESSHLFLMSGHHGRPETAHALKGRYDKRQTSFCVSPIYLPMIHSQQFLSRLDDLAVLRIEGADAVQFLQAQLSNDISSLG